MLSSIPMQERKTGLAKLAFAEIYSQTGLPVIYSHRMGM